MDKDFFEKSFTGRFDEKALADVNTKMKLEALHCPGTIDISYVLVIQSCRKFKTHARELWFVGKAEIGTGNSSFER